MLQALPLALYIPIKHTHTYTHMYTCTHNIIALHTVLYKSGTFLISLQWMRWMQIVEGVTFLLLTIWWAVTVPLLSAAQHDTSRMDATYRTGNSSITVDDSLLGDNRENKLRISLGYQLLGISVRSVTHAIVNIKQAHAEYYFQNPHHNNIYSTYTVTVDRKAQLSACSAILICA